jgi:hypothetical protein
MHKLVMWITFLAVFAMAARVSVDTDTWWHLRTGQWIIENRSIPQTDPFSYTRLGESWQYPGWLVQVPLYGLFQMGGPGALNLWTAGLVTLAFVFVWFTLSGGPFLRGFAIILGATVAAVYWAARPYLVTFLLAAIFLWILEDFRWRKVDRLWWLPLLMVVWVNCHPGFVVGILIWGAYLVYALFHWLSARLWREGDESARRRVLGRLVLVGAVMLVAVIVNPYGPAMYSYAYKTVSIGALQDYIDEWQSPDFHAAFVQPFAWLLLLTFGVVGASRRRLALTDFLLFAGFAMLGLLARRNIALFAIVALPVLTRHAASLLAAAQRKLGFRQPAVAPAAGISNRLNWLLLALVVLAVVLKVLYVLPPEINNTAFQRGLPIAAVEHLNRIEPQGRLFNSYNWGSYLLWALPEYPVFIDGRTDLYSDEVIDQWLQVIRAEPGWQQVLDGYDVRLVLIEQDSMLDRVLELESEWQVVFEDALAVIYQHK